MADKLKIYFIEHKIKIIILMVITLLLVAGATTSGIILAKEYKSESSIHNIELIVGDELDYNKYFCDYYQLNNIQNVELFSYDKSYFNKNNNVLISVKYGTTELMLKYRNRTITLNIYIYPIINNIDALHNLNNINNITIKQGHSETITFIPSPVCDAKIIYEHDNKIYYNNISKKLVGIQSGKSKLTAKIVLNEKVVAEKTLDIIVTECNFCTSINFSQDIIKIKNNNNTTFANATLDSTSDFNINYMSMNENIITVDKLTGLITPINSGSTTIRAYVATSVNPLTGELILSYDEVDVIVSDYILNVESSMSNDANIFNISLSCSTNFNDAVFNINCGDNLTEINREMISSNTFKINFILSGKITSNVTIKLYDTLNDYSNLVFNKTFNIIMPISSVVLPLSNAQGTFPIPFNNEEYQLDYGDISTSEQMLDALSREFCPYALLSFNSPDDYTYSYNLVSSDTSIITTNGNKVNAVGDGSAFVYIYCGETKVGQAAFCCKKISATDFNVISSNIEIYESQTIDLSTNISFIPSYSLSSSITILHSNNSNDHLSISGTNITGNSPATTTVLIKLGDKELHLTITILPLPVINVKYLGEPVIEPITVSTSNSSFVLVIYVSVNDINNDSIPISISNISNGNISQTLQPYMNSYTFNIISSGITTITFSISDLNITKTITVNIN